MKTLSDELCEQVSLTFQFVASLCWAIGAALAEPVSWADWLQLSAAVAWCFSNFAAAWAMRKCAFKPGIPGVGETSAVDESIAQV